MSAPNRLFAAFASRDKAGVAAPLSRYVQQDRRIRHWGAVTSAKMAPDTWSEF